MQSHIHQLEQRTEQAARHAWDAYRFSEFIFRIRHTPAEYLAACHEWHAAKQWRARANAELAAARMVNQRLTFAKL